MTSNGRQEAGGGGFFGTDGIRDLHGQGALSPDNVLRIGRAIAGFARERAPGRDPVVCLARDTRPSGPALAEGVARGLAAGGVACEDAGVLPTPALAWWAANGRCDLGIALTASHNPAPWNGVKVLLEGGRKTTEGEERVLDAAIRAADAVGAPASSCARADARAAYVDALRRFLEPGGRLDGLALVADCANGATGETAPEVLRALGADLVAENLGPPGAINDGCGTEAIGGLRASVRRRGARAGIAFDGDGDRVLLVDEEGEVLDGEHVLFLLAGDLLERDALPGRRVVTTVMANLGFERALDPLGVRVDRVPVGDRHVAQRMRETGAALGGEPSGHVLVRWGEALLGDGLLAGVLALQVARRRGIALSEARRAVPRWPQLLRNVRASRRVPLDDLPSLSRRIAEEEAGLDGTGRVLVRWSGTEPVLRIMVEGEDAGAVAAAADRLEAAARGTLG
jgi:phosphoglucosamine mutase